jgi:hypothetical protein
MNVQLLPAALEDIAVLRAAGYRGAGFLLGTRIGLAILVERLLPLDIGSAGNDAAHAAACRQYGERLQGAFFCRKPPRALEWFIGCLILAVRLREIQAFTCEFDPAVKKALLAPLAEETGAQWRN